jgi:pyruvate/2-oxoglutarate dehydrogenase complex dihydrolipoamide acyltransferase (E2) component
MAKIAAHDRALEFLKTKGSASPDEINAHVGQGNYASKYICYIKLHGYEIETIKTGRTVTEYKFIGDGDSATRNYQWVPPAERGAAPKQKTAKKAKAKAAKPVKVRQSKQTAPVAKAARNVLKDRADAEADRLIAELGMKNAGEYAGGTYSVDPDWDSMDGIDVANFLK